VATETEIKLRLPDGPAAAGELLARLGYRPQGPRTFEVNQLYDRTSGELKTSGRVLRLRAEGEQHLLTYKGPTDDGPYKSREEIELHVDDGPAMEQILLALGYLPQFRYEKYRTTFERHGEPGIITLDETPIGDFLELEGPGEWIDRTTVKLGFLKTDYLLSTYAALYDEYQKKHPTLPRNMVYLQRDSTP
jgi:adenylate cyclase class 2